MLALPQAEAETETADVKSCFCTAFISSAGISVLLRSARVSPGLGSSVKVARVLLNALLGPAEPINLEGICPFGARHICPCPERMSKCLHMSGPGRGNGPSHSLHPQGSSLDALQQFVLLSPQTVPWGVVLLDMIAVGMQRPRETCPGHHS